MLQAPVTFKNVHVTGEFYVTKRVNEPPLSLDLIYAPNILQRVNEVSTPQALDPVKEYPSLFKGLGEAKIRCLSSSFVLATTYTSSTQKSSRTSENGGRRHYYRSSGTNHHNRFIQEHLTSLLYGRQRQAKAK